MPTPNPFNPSDTNWDLTNQDEVREGFVALHRAQRDECASQKKANWRIFLSFLVAGSLALFAILLGVFALRSDKDTPPRTDASIEAVVKRWFQVNGPKIPSEENMKAIADKAVADAPKGTSEDQVLALIGRENKSLVDQGDDIASLVADLKDVKSELAEVKLKLAQTIVATVPPASVPTAVEPENRAEVIEPPVSQKVISSTKNWKNFGEQALGAEEDKLKKAVTSWLEQGGYKFPLVANRHGLPGPIKGSVAPIFLEPGSTESNWAEREVTLENPNGPGSYKTVGWAIKK